MLSDLNMIALIVVFMFIAILLGYGFYNWRRGSYHPAQLSQAREAATDLHLSDVDTEPNKLILGKVDDPWGEIVRYQKTEIDGYEEIQLDEKSLIGLSGLFHQAPNLAQSGVQMVMNTYTLSFKPEIAKGIADGSLKMMESLDGGFRAIAVNAKGKEIIQGVGSLHLAEGLKLTAGLMAVWQVLAVVTAQAFLMDINKQLVNINKELEGIKNFLEHQQYATLIGNFKYIQTIRDLLSSQSFENLEFGVFLNQLEHIERECTQIMVALELQMNTVYADFEKQPLRAYISAQENLLASKKLITNHEQQARNYLIAASVRGLATQTRCAIPSNRNLALTRLSTLQTELSTWNENQQKFYQLVSERAPELIDWSDSKFYSRVSAWLPSLTDRFTGRQKKQIQLKNKMQTSQDSINQMGELLQKSVLETKNNVRNQLQENSQPLSLLVELNENGQIIKTWKMHNRNN
ncbi:MAG: hypothetical protein IH588_08610 [Anaerolineales bacterium]|nr:hypothetical protein [Anaerolineales bacterium]